MAAQTPRRRSKLAGPTFDEPPGERRCRDRRSTDSARLITIRIRRPGPQRLRLVCKKPPIRRLRVIGRVSGADLISFNLQDEPRAASRGAAGRREYGSAISKMSSPPRWPSICPLAGGVFLPLSCHSQMTHRRIDTQWAVTGGPTPVRRTC
jgi:hypothetical protein